MRIVHGVGVNDADYIVSASLDGSRKACPFYEAWKSMMYRCYSDKNKEKRPTYTECSVSLEWHNFMAFRDWMSTQDWVGKHLDKDLIKFGNKVYSKETCMFLPQSVNCFISTEGRSKKDKSVPVGVFWKQRDLMYQAQCNDLGRGVKTLGYHKTKEQARKAYLDFKISLCREVSGDDDHVYLLLLEYFENHKSEATM